MLKAFLCFAALIPFLGAEPGYRIETIAGSAFPGDDGPATSALLVQAQGIAIDGTGNVYVADAGDNRVRKISPLGTIKTIAGTGIGGFSGDGGPAISARLNHPYGVALDLEGNIFVADLGNARVRRIDTKGVISTVAGGGNTVITAASAYFATDVALVSPRNVAIDVLGKLYISDFGGQYVYEVTREGGLTVFAGTGAAGLGGDGGAATLAQLSYPAGLATDAFGNVFIADSGNQRVRRVWRGAITTVAIDVPSPTGVALDAAGRLYVASAAAVSGSHAASPAGLTVQLASADDVASDPGGVLYLATRRHVQKQIGTLLVTIAGCENCAAFGDGGPAISARLEGPVAFALNAAKELYIAEQSGNRVRKVNAAGVISSVAGNDASQVKGPSGIALGANGTIFFTELETNRVRRISAGGVVTTVLDKLNAPTCVRTASDGALYVCDRGNNRVIQITPAGIMSTFAEVVRPSGLALDDDGSVYVSSGAQVLRIAAGSGPTVVVDGLGDPAGLAVAASGEVIIAEAGKNRVLKLGAGGVITVLAGTGHAGSAGEGGAAAAAELNNPQDVAVDSAGNILIADSGNNRICRLTAILEPEKLIAPITVVNAASMLAGPVARDEIVTIFGSDFDPAHVQVTFDKTPATVFYASASQLNVLVPATIKVNASSDVEVLSNGAAAGSASVETGAYAPGIFTMGSGTGQAAALDEAGVVNSTANPIARGSVVALYVTGASGAAMTVKIGGYTAEVLYAGPAPGFPGLSQINARVPSGFLAPGTQPVVVTAGSATSQPGVTLEVY